MPSQMGVVTRSKRRRNQIAELEARQSLLPQMIANQQRKEDLERANELQDIQVEQWNKDYSLAQDQQAWNRKAYQKTKNATERTNRIGMGLEATKLGLNLGQQYGNKTLGNTMFSKSTAPISSSFTPTTGAYEQWSYGKDAGDFASKAINEFKVGSFIGGGLTGYGASRLVNKKKKGKRFAIGAGAGALSGFLSGGPSGALAGGIGGGIGSLF